MTEFDSADQFELLAKQLSGEPGVSRAKMFGADGLRVGAKFFATYFRGDLVLKLPRDRVESLIESGEGEPFDPGMGRVMKEWVVVKQAPPDRWLELTSDARDFVAGIKRS